MQFLVAPIAKKLSYDILHFKESVECATVVKMFCILVICRWKYQVTSQSDPLKCSF